MEKPQLKPFQLALVLVSANIIFRLIWLIVSKGAYTDGILQLTAFSNGLTFWPPLYTLLSYIFAWVPGVGQEGSARIISLLAGSLAVIPIEAAARRLFGARAAILAAVIYTISPGPLRWSVAVMTDATFMALWISSLASLVIAGQYQWPDLYEQTKEKAKSDAKRAGNWLLLASLFGALATLTRYQGIFLLPVTFMVALRAGKKTESETKPMLPGVLNLLPWGMVILWVAAAALLTSTLDEQVEQFADRTSAGGIMATLVNYWFVLEQFVMTSPYFLTYGIFGFFLYGLFRIKFSTKRILVSIVTAGFLTIGILILQSAFQAFQTRYILPIVPFIAIIAGHGMAVWERHCKDKMARFYVLVGPTLLHALIFSCLVAFYQGNPFIDLKKAGQWIKKNVPEDAKIYSNEHYNGKIGAAKLAYWSGRKLEDISPFQFQNIKPGDYIVLSSFYGATGVDVDKQMQVGGLSQFRYLLDIINSLKYTKASRDAIASYPAKPAAPPFTYSTIPLLPDIMEEPLAHTNPLAFYLRYRRQYFETVVLKVVDFSDLSEEELSTGVVEGSEGESKLLKNLNIPEAVPTDEESAGEGEAAPAEGETTE